MKAYIGALLPLVWGALTVVLELHGIYVPNGLFYGVLIIAMMVGIMLGVMVNERK
jgi:hypothetical protein